MGLFQDVDKGVLPSNTAAEEISTQDSLRIEPMTEYKSNRDEADLARFGKQQRLNVHKPFLASELY